MIGDIAANFFCSVGHSLGKIYTGMIVHLCDPWNEGKREPLDSFLDYLNLLPGEHYALHKAWEGNSLI